MMLISRATGIAAFLITGSVCAFALASAGQSQNTPPDNTNSNAPALIQQMAGTWDVRQRMWPGPGAEAVELPSAVAYRELIGGAFLEEVMTLPRESEQEPFTRIAYFNYNAVNRQYEYFSIDSRAPQMMIEMSHDADVHGKARDQGQLALYGGTFVAPNWGKFTDSAFRYRLVLGAAQSNSQIARLYLTPLSGETAGEFLAFEYVYTRRN